MRAPPCEMSINLDAVRDSREFVTVRGTSIRNRGNTRRSASSDDVLTTRTRIERNAAMFADALAIAPCTSTARMLTSSAPPLTFAIRELTSRLDCAD